MRHRPNLGGQTQSDVAHEMLPLRLGDRSRHIREELLALGVASGRRPIARAR